MLEEKYKSALLYQFTRLIEWNDYDNENEFIIGVVGNSNITEYLYKLAELKTVNEKRIIIKEWTSIDYASNCHFLFLCSSNQNQLYDAIEKAQNHNAILITENNGFAEKGSGINFVIERNSVRYETNIASINSTFRFLHNSIPSLTNSSLGLGITPPNSTYSTSACFKESTILSYNPVFLI